MKSVRIYLVGKPKRDNISTSFKIFNHVANELWHKVEVVMLPLNHNICDKIGRP